MANLHGQGTRHTGCLERGNGQTEIIPTWTWLHPYMSVPSSLDECAECAFILTWVCLHHYVNVPPSLHGVHSSICISVWVHGCALIPIHECAFIPAWTCLHPYMHECAFIPKHICTFISTWVCLNSSLYKRPSISRWTCLVSVHLKPVILIFRLVLFYCENFHYYDHMYHPAIMHCNLTQHCNPENSNYSYILRTSLYSYSMKQSFIR